MRRILLLILSIVFSGVLISCNGSGSAVQQKPISQIFAFGDSLSDNGAIWQLTQKMVAEKVKDAVVLPDTQLYWQGHWTNGLTAVEVLANRLQVSLTDYAVGGAKSGSGNTIQWLNSYEDTGVWGQIDKFKATLKDGRADPDALYFIFASANDFGEHEDYSLPGTLPDLADQAITNIETAISRLAGMGAKRFLIGNSAHLSVMPYNITQKLTDHALIFQTRFNSELPTRLDKLKSKLGVEITLFDYTATIDMIRANPAQYGLKNLTRACQPIFFGVGAVCSAPDEYFFWDESHPTRRVHQIVGEAMATIFGK
jgi:phospholipase/lecithinase/hemolysin